MWYHGNKIYPDKQADEQHKNILPLPTLWGCEDIKRNVNIQNVDLKESNEFILAWRNDHQSFEHKHNIVACKSTFILFNNNSNDDDDANGNNNRHHHHHLIYNTDNDQEISNWIVKVWTEL